MSELERLLSPLKEFYDLLNEGILVLDNDHRLCYCNPASQRLLAMDADSDTLPSRIVTIPDLKDTYYAEHGNSRKKNGIVYLDNGVTKTPTTYLCFCICDDVTGEQLGQLVFFEDPALKRYADKDPFALKAELLHALNSCITEVVIVINRLSQQIVFANDAMEEIIGWRPDEYMRGGFPFAISLIHPEDLDSFRRLHQEKIASNTKGSTLTNSSFSSTARMRHAGGHYIPLDFSCTIVERNGHQEPVVLLFFARPQKNTGLSIEFSRRELEIAQLLAQGKSSKIIANFFNLSVHTINGYRIQMMKKTGTNNTVALVNYLREKKML